LKEFSYEAPEYVWPEAKIKLFSKSKDSDDAIEPSDVNQGDLGNCWFVAGLSVVAVYPELINAVIGRHDVKKGIYEFNFWCDNNLDTRSVCVDCRIPVMNGYPHMTNSKTEGELWPALLEKAFAKFYGCYGALAGGKEAVAFTNLTGKPCKIFDCQYDGDKFSDPEQLWGLIAQLWAEGHIMGISFKQVSDKVAGPRGEKTAAGGLISGHAYGVLAVCEVGDVKLLKV
jgi:calpain-5